MKQEEKDVKTIEIINNLKDMTEKQREEWEAACISKNPKTRAYCDTILDGLKKAGC